LEVVDTAGMILRDLRFQRLGETLERAMMASTPSVKEVEEAEEDTTR
jgi:hypothetical protein